MKSKIKTKNGEVVEIEIDEDDFTAIAKNPSGEKIGSIRFRLIEYPNGEVLRMTHAFLNETGPRYLHQGIGTECVRLMGKITGLPIVASLDDGLVKSDGSHLTGDAPIFVEKLKAKGLISNS